MTRSRLVALVAVLAVVLTALWGQWRPSSGGTDGDRTAVPGVPALRAAADLAPCPDGVGPGLPDLALPCLGTDGQVRLRADGADRPRLVNLWATWCGPCVREVPRLQRLHASDAVDVLGVLTQDTVENGLRFAADPAVGGMHYPSVVDDQGALLRRYAREVGPGLPKTLFVRPDGRIAHVESGELTDAELRSLLARHLGVRT